MFQLNKYLDEIKNKSFFLCEIDLLHCLKLHLMKIRMVTGTSRKLFLFDFKNTQLICNYDLEYFKILQLFIIDTKMSNVFFDVFW